MEQIILFCTHVVANMQNKTFSPSEVFIEIRSTSHPYHLQDELLTWLVSFQSFSVFSFLSPHGIIFLWACAQSNAHLNWKGLPLKLINYYMLLSIAHPHLHFGMWQEVYKGEILSLSFCKGGGATKRKRWRSGRRSEVGLLLMILS